MQTLPYHIGNAWFDGLLPVIVRDFAGPALTSSDTKWLPGVAMAGAAAPAAPS